MSDGLLTVHSISLWSVLLCAPPWTENPNARRGGGQRIWTYPSASLLPSTALGKPQVLNVCLRVMGKLIKAVLISQEGKTRSQGELKGWP